VATSTDATVPRIGLLLAGGASTRMGRDKAGLDWQGQPLIAHMHALLSALPLSQVVVSGARPEYAGVIDQAPGRGPLGGIASAAQVLPDCVLLVVPVDMPRLALPLLQRLLDAPPRACTRFAESPLPMRLQLDGDLRLWLAAWLRDPDAPRALHRLQAALNVQSLALGPEERAQLANANTPADWQRLASG
jgi:molybdopterin-guanine dinucleotide biosynthesis protein A